MQYPLDVPRAQDQLPSRFRRALLYVVEQLGSVNVTRLQKILYLADLEHFNATGTTLTGARWVRYTHGPMAKALLPSRELMDGHEIEIRAEEWGEYEAQVYRPGPEPRFGPDLAPEEMATLDKILKLTRDLGTSQTINIAYNTIPMRVIQSLERAGGGGILLNADIPFDIDAQLAADVSGQEPQVSPEERGRFKEQELARIADLQETALSSLSGE